MIAAVLILCALWIVSKEIEWYIDDIRGHK